MLAEGPLPDDESFNLVVGLLIRSKHFDTALKYLDLMLKYGRTLNPSIYNGCIQFLLNSNKPDAAASFIDKCKVWLCIYVQFSLLILFGYGHSNLLFTFLDKC
jgi:pentatricopeptide repeat protein